MNLTKLDPALRENLRNLLQGYIEHCEMSDNLVAKIETPIYYHGFKFGAPVFTHRHPAVPAERPSVGIAGINEPTDSGPSEIVLQIIEMLAQHPADAGFRPVRLMPVANPVALELEDSAPASSEWPLLSHLLEEFHSTVSAGFLKISSSADDGFSIRGTATPEILHNIASLNESTRSLRRIEILPAEDSAWNLDLSVPAGCSAGSILAAARFAVSLIRPR